MAHLASVTTTGKSPNWYYEIYADEIGRDNGGAMIRITYKVKVVGSGSSSYGYKLNFRGWAKDRWGSQHVMKGTERWYGSDGIRTFTTDIWIPAGLSAETVGIAIQQIAPEQSSSSANLTSSTYHFTISHRNSAPWWTSDDAHIQIGGTAYKYNAIIPENTNDVLTVGPQSYDNEQGNNIHYDIYRNVNWNGGVIIQAGGYGRNRWDNLNILNAGHWVRYEYGAHDGNGLWCNGARTSWLYKKNIFYKASIATNDRIAHNTSSIRINIGSASNHRENNFSTICADSFGYRLDSHTNGVNLYGNREYWQGNTNNFGWTIAIQENVHPDGGIITIKPSELRNAFRNGNFTGTLRLNIHSWNNYGSNGDNQCNINVDLRSNPAYTSVWSKGGYITHKNSRYHIPSHINQTITWDRVNSPVDGSECTYELRYQLDGGNWTWIAATGTNKSYTVNMPSIIGNRNSHINFIVRAITSYGYYTDSGLTGYILDDNTTRINTTSIRLYSYTAPSVSIDNTNRTENAINIKGKIIPTNSIPSVDLTSTHWRWDDGGNNTNFNTGSNNSFDITASGLSPTDSRPIHIASSDSVRDILVSKGYSPVWGSINYQVSNFNPLMSMRDNGVGFGCVPAENIERAAIHINGGIEHSGKGYNFHNKITIGGDANTYYLVHIPFPKDAIDDIYIHRDYQDPAPASWNTSTHPGGCHLKVSALNNRWGGASSYLNVDHLSQTYSAQIGRMEQVGNGRYDLGVWLRGGGAHYNIKTNSNSKITVHYSDTTIEGLLYTPLNKTSNKVCQGIFTDGNERIVYSGIFHEAPQGVGIYTYGATLQNGWVNYGVDNWEGARYGILNGICYVYGLIRGGVSDVAFTLPKGFRPGVRVMFPSIANNGFGRIDIDTAGQVIISLSNNAKEYTSLNCEFPVYR